MIDLSAWPALVLTAGLGTRLRPLSDVRAKAALPVAGTPIVGRILRWLRDAGITRVVLNLHHRPETVTRVVGDGAEWGLQVRYSWEMPLLGSGGGPARALPLLDAERFLIVNGDTLTDCDLRAVAEQHVKTGALVTMALVEKDVERLVIVDGHDTVRGFANKRALAATKPGADAFLHFIGVQAVNASVFAGVPPNQASESINQLYPPLITGRPGTVRAYRSTAEFLDVGTPADYLETVKVVSSREGAAWDRGAGTTVHPTARVDRSILWDRVTVGAAATLVECIVADGVAVPAGAQHERQSLVSADGTIKAFPL